MKVYLEISPIYLMGLSPHKVFSGLQPYSAFQFVCVCACPPHPLQLNILAGRSQFSPGEYDSMRRSDILILPPCSSHTYPQNGYLHVTSTLLSKVKVPLNFL